MRPPAGPWRAYSRPSGDSAVINPSRRAVVTESATVSTTPVHVTIHADTAAVTTNTGTGTVRSSKAGAGDEGVDARPQVGQARNRRRMPGRS